MKKTDEGYELKRQEASEMIWLYVLANHITVHAPEFMAYARERGVYREIMSALGLLKRAWHEMYDAVTEAQRNSIGNQTAHTSIEIKPRPIGDFHGAYIVDGAHLDTLAEYARKAECDMCMRSGGEIKRCPLRKTLLAVTPPQEHSKYRCEYADEEG